ncbi:G-protein coupled receptor Fz Smo [Desmophyllum pertusum]|uniref:G-protein coupled receptor Fz Smo n=1 Tax=Desmophyllum pertusum TaxID=174260 RepID=A0A9W9Z8Z1_9CNID|nr:G-protein coupled receptor Fz Smo [Desmophyllum pertusum]
MKVLEFFWLGILLFICNAAKQEPRIIYSTMNIKVKPLSPHTLQMTWDPPLLSETLVGYSLVLFQAHDKTRMHVEIFMNHYILTNLRPGTRYKIKLAPLMNNGKLKGSYSKWVNARTPPENKTSSGQSPDSTVKPPSSSLLSGHCSRIGKLCQNMGYNFTQMPNYFNQQSQNDATHELSQFTRMIQSKCSSVLHVFLCSLYFPPCLDDAESATPPCRSVCRAARRGCESSRFKWPYKFKCSGFPERSDQACVGEDGSITHGKN